MRRGCGTNGREVHAGVWQEKVKKNHLEYLAIAGRIIINQIFNTQNGKHLVGLIFRLRIKRSCGLF